MTDHDQQILQKGRSLLGQPVLPLVGMVQFLYLTGDFASVDEVIAQMPTGIATNHATYGDPVALLTPYSDLLQPVVDLKAGKTPEEMVVDAHRQGREYGLELPGRVLPPAHEESHLHHCLEALAMYGFEGGFENDTNNKVKEQGR